MSNETEVQETTETGEESVETKTTEVNTDSSINASLDEIDDPETLKKMVKKLRGENAKARTNKNATEAELREFKAWKESQMTELEKAQAARAELEAELQLTRLEKLLIEFELDEDDAEFITGTPEEMRKKAEKLAAKRTKETETPTRRDLFAGNRGTSVRQNKASGGSWLEQIATNS